LHVGEFITVARAARVVPGKQFPGGGNSRDHTVGELFRTVK
jgi:hypothetical protein